MGQSNAKSSKTNKNHNKHKMLRVGVSFGRNDLQLEVHLQMGNYSKTIKNYTAITNEEERDEETENAIEES